MGRSPSSSVPLGRQIPPRRRRYVMACLPWAEAFLRALRLRLERLCDRRWLPPARSRITLPVLVTLKRLAIDRFDFIFGMERRSFALLRRGGATVPRASPRSRNLRSRRGPPIPPTALPDPTLGIALIPVPNRLGGRP